MKSQKSRIQIGQRRTIETLDCESPTGEKFKRILNFESWAKKHDGIGGIYVIWNNQKKCYVGKADDFGRRWREHRAELFKIKHVNQELQKDWTQMGADAFRFDVMEKEASGNIGNAEKRYIQLLNSYFRGYNKTKDGERIENYRKKQPIDNVVYETDDDILHVFILDPKEMLIEPPGKTNPTSQKIDEINKPPVTLSPIDQNPKVQLINPAPLSPQTNKPIDKQVALPPTLPRVHGPLSEIIKPKAAVTETSHIAKAYGYNGIDETSYGVVPPMTTPIKPDPPQPQKPKPDPKPIPPVDPEKSWLGMWAFILFVIVLISAILSGNDAQDQGVIIYEIQSGDTLSKIAKKHGVEVNEVIETNEIVNKDLVEPGMTIVIPGKK